ncbi:Outer membrane lipoprotein SlyB [Nymphon striatum]|nr:Outer membrane lipoprotein SlyB [Nymphon striatum]
MEEGMNKFIMMFLGLSLILVGCSSNAPLAENKAGTIKEEKVIRVQQGTVTAVKSVSVLGEKSNVGASVGRTAGSIAGSVLSSGYGGILGSMVGGMLGGSVGGSADKGLRKKPGLEITMRLVDGKKVTVTQLATTQFKIGDKVKLVMDDSKAKVVPI